MVKIVVTQPMEFSAAQKVRLDKLGDVTYYDTTAKSPEEWLERCKGFDIICTGGFGFRDKWRELHGVFVSVPFISTSWADLTVMKEHNVTVSNSPGCNRYPVSEWIIAMMLIMARQMDKYLRVKEVPTEMVRTPTKGLAYKKIAILGKGNIGSQVGTVAAALEMDVIYFQRGDTLSEKVKDADVVVDCLGSSSSTRGILNKGFFDALKDGAIFISITGETIVDIDAMLAALDSGKLSYLAHDSGGISVGDTKDPFYQKLLKHPNVYVTPHIAFNTDVERKMCDDMMIDNVEAWVNGRPINIVM
jgi:D-3-phosphoglycerate dehydrogenase / 2-oxoglutarate reductase